MQVVLNFESDYRLRQKISWESKLLLCLVNLSRAIGRLWSTGTSRIVQNFTDYSVEHNAVDIERISGRLDTKTVASVPIEQSGRALHISLRDIALDGRLLSSMR